MTGSRLSSWQSQQQKCRNKRDKLQKQVNQLLKEISWNDKKVRDLQVKIDELNNQEIVVCDHAKKRYRERFNEEATDEQIFEDLVDEEVKYLIGILGNGEFPSKDKHLVVKDRVIITVF